MRAMSKNLVIVESPAKAKTIEKFLGKDFEVMSSMGHIRDLSDKGLGIDFGKQLRASVRSFGRQEKIVADLKSRKAADVVWLASDEDREGEAIAWHLAEELKLKKDNTKRIVFHEITKDAILRAIENPRDINLNLVDAQQARRVLDRIVGFEISPILWRKVRPALSAGRVQSVAVRLIVEREREINNFVAESSYKVSAIFTSKDANGNPIELKAELSQRFATKEEANAFLETCKDAEFSVDNIEKKPAKNRLHHHLPPLHCNKKPLVNSVSLFQTMMVAQRLYESGKSLICVPIL